MGHLKKLPIAFQPKELSLGEYCQLRDKLLLVRDTGGAGDILMCRMIFEDFKDLNPSCHLTFACPLQYHDLVEDHPYVDEVVDSNRVDLSEYIVSYNITTICGKYEMELAPYSEKHRSDVWANHCGVKLKKHNMHLNVEKDITKSCLDIIESHRKHETGPPILISPVSAIRSKDLSPRQTNDVITELRKMGYLVLALHKKPLKKLKVPTICADSFKQFLGFVNASSYIITVDTATFHAAGGLSKPQVAVFSWADGKVYGRWFKNYILVQRHRDNGDWDCGPCYRWFDCPKEKCRSRKPCITSITSNEIVEATKEIIKRWPEKEKNGK